MDQAGVTRPPRLRGLADMRSKTSILERTPPSFRSDDDYPEISTERRAKVKIPGRREIDQGSVVTSSSNSSSRARATKRPNRSTPASASRPKDGESIISKWSRPSVVKPLFEFDSASLLSSESTTKSMLHNDTPWRAAKRGDLNALKQFHASGKVDWMAKDEFDNIPLYYACHTGALVDIMVVPFLLWVTSLQDQHILEKCKRNAVNRQVRCILKAYIKGGITGVVTNDGIGSSVDSRQSAQASKSVVRGSKLSNKESPVIRPSGDRGSKIADKDITVSRIDSKEPKKSTRKSIPADTETVDSRKNTPVAKSTVADRTTTRGPQDPPSSDVVVNITDNHEDGMSIIETASQISATQQQSFEIVHSSPQTNTLARQSPKYHGRVDDHASQRSLHSDADSAVQFRGKSGSLKSMLFGDRDKTDNVSGKREKSKESSNGHESANARSQARQDRYRTHQTGSWKYEEQRITPSRLHDENSVVDGVTKARKPPISTNSGFSKKKKDLPPRPPPKQSTKDFVSWDSREEREIETEQDYGNEDREDWDSPIEQHRFYGHQDTKESNPSTISRDDDSWSIASLLSLKKWRNNKKQLDPEKIDKIMFTHKEKDTKSASEASDPPSMVPASHPGLQSNKTKGKVSSRGNFPKAYIEYHENDKTWVIGNQWKQNGNGEKDKMIHVCDNRQRVHVTNCHGVNIHIHGRKMKAILIENSSDVNVIYDTVISTCEVVGCSNVGLQVTGLCPTFSIDSTQGVIVWLTREAMTSSNFVTTKSHDVCISVPQGDDMHPWERKEVPLPVQYVHKFQEGGIMTHLPGKY